MNDESNRTPKTRRNLVARFLIALCVVVVPIASCPITWEMVSIRVTEHRMRSPEVYQEVATQLALLCQTVPEEIRTLRGSHSWLPKVVRDLDPSYGTIEPDYCRIEMGGGFYHFRYYLVRDAVSSTRENNVWELSIYDDNSSGAYIKITLKANEQLSDEQCVQLVTEGIKDTTSERPGEIRPYQDAYYFLIKLAKREAARKLCDDAIEAIPEHWWPRLTAALMDSNGPTAETATDRFKKWVDANPSLSHYVYLSYFYNAIGNDEAACQAATKAVKQSFVEGPCDEWSCWAYAHEAAVIAFESDCYEAVIDIAEKIYMERAGQDYGEIDTLGMKAVAHFLLGEQKQAVSSLKDAKPDHPNAMLYHDLAKAFETRKRPITIDEVEEVKNWVRPKYALIELCRDLPVKTIIGETDRPGS